ncbi:MAG TPA: DUF1840 domain-containing protein [Gammaproteobacteria bacterium]|jgi:hypothetical protein
MLVTFQTQAYANITMFGDVAKQMLTLMGHSGTVPSAIAAEDVAAALEKLRKAVAALPPSEKKPGKDNEPGGEPPRVGLAQRAYPLIKLLEAAAAENVAVSWRAG